MVKYTFATTLPEAISVLNKIMDRPINTLTIADSDHLISYFNHLHRTHNTPTIANTNRVIITELNQFYVVLIYTNKVKVNGTIHYDTSTAGTVEFEIYETVQLCNVYHVGTYYANLFIVDVIHDHRTSVTTVLIHFGEVIHHQFLNKYQIYNVRYSSVTNGNIHDSNVRNKRLSLINLLKFYNNSVQ